MTSACKQSKLTHSSRNVSLIFQASQWWRERVFCRRPWSWPALLPAGLWQKDCAREEWLWQDFPISATHMHLYFPSWNLWFCWCLWFSRKAELEKTADVLHFPLTRGATGLCYVVSVGFSFQRCRVSYKGHERQGYTEELLLMLFHPGPKWRS